MNESASREYCANFRCLRGWKEAIHYLWIIRDIPLKHPAWIFGWYSRFLKKATKDTLCNNKYWDGVYNK